MRRIRYEFLLGKKKKTKWRTLKTEEEFQDLTPSTSRHKTQIYLLGFALKSHTIKASSEILNLKITWNFNIGASPHWEKRLQKLAYAAVCGGHTVLFSKRRKNSSPCAHRTAPWSGYYLESLCYISSLLLRSNMYPVWDGRTKLKPLLKSKGLIFISYLNFDYF